MKQKYHRKYYIEHKNKILENAKKYYQDHKEEILNKRKYNNSNKKVCIVYLDEPIKITFN